MESGLRVHALARVGEPATLEPRETSGITSRLLLTYAEREGGRAAVEAILRRCDLADSEDQLRDEDHWFSFATKVRLFEAAAEVLDDPLVTRHMGEQALEMGVGEAVKAALRALGTPALVYRNVVRANARFNSTHAMELVELGRDHARLRFVDVAGVGFHPLDCEYNVGMLSCVPVLFGRPPALISHHACVAAGADACVYDVSWAHDGSPVRTALACGAVGAAAIVAPALLAPALMPVGAAVAATAAGTVVWSGARRHRRRWHERERELMGQAALGHRLAASLQDLAGELRLDELLAKITRHARAAVGGKEYALLVEDEDGHFGCRSSSGLPPAVVRTLEGWANRDAARLSEPLVLEDLASVPELSSLPCDEVMPLGSLCSAPLIYRGRGVGALVALGNTSRAFLPGDVELLRSYAVQTAIALTNARLFEAQERLAARDPLTGLLNRREFRRAAAREIERCHRHGGGFAIALFDLDGFKLVNDAGGHSEGDAALRRVALAISESCRASDLAFRFGGDEFAVLLPEAADRAAATASAERTSEAVAATDARLAASYGVATWPADGDELDSLLAAADRGLYAMKGTRPSPLVALSRAYRPERLAVASRLSTRLSPLRDAGEIARVTVAELDESFGYFLAAVQRVDPDGVLRLVAATGPLAEQAEHDWEQSVHQGVNGRVARSGEPALVPDTRHDPDFVAPSGISRSSRSELAVPIRVAGRIWGVLNVEHTEPGAFDGDDLLLLDTIAAQVGSALHLAELFQRLENTFAATVGVLSGALEAKDAYTAAHTRDVADLAERVGVRLGVYGEDLRFLRYAALLHDIGKIGVRSEILAKPGPLTEEEFEEIKRHTVIGARMLERIPDLAAVVPLVRSAHEHWDGSGYPDGLAGERIPLGARVVCACDAFHAMISNRPYSPAMPIEAAVEELHRCAASQFDPAVVDALVAELAQGERSRAA